MNKIGLKAVLASSLALGLLWTCVPVFADTVVLRSGRKFSNVKTRLTKGRIIITDQRGRVRSYRARDIKLMLPGAVNWKAPVRKRPVRKPPRRVVKKPPVRKVTPPAKVAPKKQPEPAKVVVNNPVVPRAVNNAGYPSPWSRARDSLLPFWSGFYSGGRRNLGFLFSGLEVAAVALLLPWLSQPDSVQSGNPELVLITAGLLPAPPPLMGAPPMDPPPPFSAPRITQNLPRALPLLGSLGLVTHPITGGTIQRSAHTSRRNSLLTGTAVLLLAHAALAYYLEPPSVGAGGGQTAGAGSAQPGGNVIFALDPGLTPANHEQPSRGRHVKVGYALRF